MTQQLPSLITRIPDPHFRHNKLGAGRYSDLSLNHYCMDVWSWNYMKGHQHKGKDRAYH